MGTCADTAQTVKISECVRYNGFHVPVGGVDDNPAGRHSRARTLPLRRSCVRLLPSPFTWREWNCGTTVPTADAKGGESTLHDVIMVGELQRGGNALTTLERNAVVAAVSAVAMRYRIERTTARLKMRLSIRRQCQLLQQVMEAPDCVSISESIVQFCCAIASGMIPWATPRWWMRRRTGGTWEDLRKMDDTADDYYKEKFRMSPRVFREIVEALSPLLQRRRALVLCAFEAKGFPNCYGCIDCTHIYVDKPANAPSENYFDRKHRFSVVAQVVVDLDLLIRDIFVGYPGSCHDIRVLQLSSMWARAEEGDLFRGPAVVLSFGVKTHGYFLGDNGYPPLEWIVVPYGGTDQCADEERFDNKQKVARGAMERAFGRLKGMWRLFLRTHKSNMDTLPQQLQAVCILHNILLDAGVEFDENLLWEVDANGVRRRVDLGIDHPPHPIEENFNRPRALALREALTERMKH
ncbi:hypothetical protein CBR_g6695 [Chara braunii]|uniref:DDE Tnp4 domain-containing protein n=1 Tax=Chara braunii TaxID=69332 RepID=A0A388KKK2_CHABU|nr:hypothetical protein CBR_g6695 [Chara braunii]|eukprot:GBG70569.1 hypothetical protein CBR_g6695 [Chara braunii]